jgi:hypothetical protein
MPRYMLLDGGRGETSSHDHKVSEELRVHAVHIRGARA